MTPAFTPGPWKIDWWQSNLGKHAASVGPIKYDFVDWHLITASDADIHLIAAAPDLYDVVVRCREAYGKYGALVNEPGAPGELVAMIDAALAKANGETQ